MAVDLLRSRLDSQDRRAHREWLKHRCDIYPAVDIVEDGEDFYAGDPDVDDPDNPQNDVPPAIPDSRIQLSVPCLIDLREHMVKTSLEELKVARATVQFAANIDVKPGYILKNCLERNGAQIAPEMRVDDVVTDDHPTRSVLLTTAFCGLH